MGSCLGSDEQVRATAHDTNASHRNDPPNTEKTGLLSGLVRSASYNVREEAVATGLDDSGLGSRSPQLASSALSSTSCYISGDHKQVPKPQAMSTFEFLDRNYAVETPSCLLPAVNELFKNISERYDIAVTNREKVDEALQLFKKVLEVESTLPISDCFTAWRSQLSNPKFTVTRSDTTGDVKQITVRAEEVPRLKRKAQKHIRDLLDACHLFLQQRDFLKREIQTSLNELDQISKNVPMLCKETKSLSSLEKKSMPQVVKRAKEQFSQFPGTIDRFWNQIFGLLCEINASVHILEDE